MQTPICMFHMQADDALAYILGLIPSHHEDMVLIEQLDHLLEAARRKARTELGRNSDAAAAIDAELGKLEATLALPCASPEDLPCSKGAGLARKDSKQAQSSDVNTETLLTRKSSSPPRRSPPRQPSAMKLRFQPSIDKSSTGKSSSDAAGSGGHANRPQALQQCKTILVTIDALRGMLYRQAKALNFLRCVQGQSFLLTRRRLIACFLFVHSMQMEYDKVIQQVDELAGGFRSSL